MLNYFFAKKRCDLTILLNDKFWCDVAYILRDDCENDACTSKCKSDNICDGLCIEIEMYGVKHKVSYCKENSFKNTTSNKYCKYILHKKVVKSCLRIDI